MSLESFTQQRFVDVLNLLSGWGMTIAHGREPSRWSELTHREPPQGYLHVKAYASLPPQEPVAFLELSEHWTETKQHPYALTRVSGGCFLHAASYHVVVGERQWRYDLDVDRHPEAPYHHHAPGSDERRPWNPSPGDVVPWVVQQLYEEYAVALGGGTLDA